MTRAAGSSTVAQTASKLKIAGFVQSDADLELFKSFVVGDVDDGQTLWRGDITTAVRVIDLVALPDIIFAEADLTKTGVVAESVHDLADRGVHVTLIGAEDSALAYRRALELGARDYIAKPLSAEKLTQSVNLVRQHALGRRRKICRVIGCIGASSAVGGTTVAANLAWRIAAETEREVALLDPDRFVSDLPFIFDIEPVRELREHFEARPRSDGAVLATLPAQATTRLSIYAMDDDFDASARLANPEWVLGALRQTYDVVLIDLKLTDIRDNNPILAHLTDAVVVATPTFVSLRNTNRIMRFLQREYPALASRILLNQTSATPECSAAEIKKALETAEVLTLPFALKDMARARLDAQPLAALTPRHPWVLALGRFMDADLGFKLSAPKSWLKSMMGTRG